MEVAVSMPVAVNCWVWPTKITGLAGARVTAWAATSLAASEQKSVRTVEITRTFVPALIAGPLADR